MMVTSNTTTSAVSPGRSSSRQELDIQSDTFLNWCAYVLADRHVDFDGATQKDAISRAFRTGTKLIELVKKLSANASIPTPHPAPLTEQECMENIAAGLALCEEEGVFGLDGFTSAHEAGIRAEDLYAGRVDSIISLLYRLVSHYDILNVHRIQSTKVINLHDRPLPAPSDVILSWIRSFDDDEALHKCRDLSQAMRDGTILFALISHIVKEALPATPPNDPIETARMAMDVARDELEVPPLLSPEDLCNTQCDTLSVMVYIAQIRCAIETREFLSDPYLHLHYLSTRILGTRAGHEYDEMDNDANVDSDENENTSAHNTTVDVFDEVFEVVGEAEKMQSKRISAIIKDSPAILNGRHDGSVPRTATGGYDSGDSTSGDEGVPTAVTDRGQDRIADAPPLVAKRSYNDHLTGEDFLLGSTTSAVSLFGPLEDDDDDEDGFVLGVSRSSKLHPGAKQSRQLESAGHDPEAAKTSGQGLPEQDERSAQMDHVSSLLSSARRQNSGSQLQHPGPPLPPRRPSLHRKVNGTRTDPKALRGQDASTYETPLSRAISKDHVYESASNYDLRQTASPTRDDALLPSPGKQPPHYPGRQLPTTAQASSTTHFPATQPATSSRTTTTTTTTTSGNAHTHASDDNELQRSFEEHQKLLKNIPPPPMYNSDTMKRPREAASTSSAGLFPRGSMVADRPHHPQDAQWLAYPAQAQMVNLHGWDGELWMPPTHGKVDGDAFPCNLLPLEAGVRFTGSYWLVIAPSGVLLFSRDDQLVLYWPLNHIARFGCDRENGVFGINIGEHMNRVYAGNYHFEMCRGDFERAYQYLHEFTQKWAVSQAEGASRRNSHLPVYNPDMEFMGSIADNHDDDFHRRLSQQMLSPHDERDVSTSHQHMTPGNQMMAISPSGVVTLEHEDGNSASLELPLEHPHHHHYQQQQHRQQQQIPFQYHVQYSADSRQLDDLDFEHELGQHHHAVSADDGVGPADEAGSNRQAAITKRSSRPAPRRNSRGSGDSSKHLYEMAHVNLQGKQLPSQAHFGTSV